MIISGLYFLKINFHKKIKFGKEIPASELREQRPGADEILEKSGSHVGGRYGEIWPSGGWGRGSLGCAHVLST